MIEIMIMVYVLIPVVSFNRGLWENFRYDLVYKGRLNHYVGMTMFIPFWSFYVIQEILFAKEIKSGQCTRWGVIKIFCEYKKYRTACQANMYEEGCESLAELMGVDLNSDDTDEVLNKLMEEKMEERRKRKLNA